MKDTRPDSKKGVAYATALRRMHILAELLDARFRVPGTKIRFGWDAIVGLIPGAGDSLAVLPQLYIVFEAVRLRLGGRIIAKMLLNILIDWLLGSVPFVGDLFDVAFKSNLRNCSLAVERIEQIERETLKDPRR